MSTVRVVRPRPLAFTDRIPVFWPGNEPSQELKQIDSGALYRHLVTASTPAANRKRQRTEKYHAPKEGEAHEHFSPVRKAHEQQAKDTGPIAIPQVRTVQDYHLNQHAALQHGPMIEGDVAAAPYLRHQQVLPGVYDEHQPTEYNVDEEDVAWLANINTKNGQGLFAAAVGLYRQMSQRISGGPDCSTPQAQELRLSIDDFERAIDALEMAHFAAVKSWWKEEQTGPCTSTPQLPKIPAVKALLPRAAALDVVASVVSDRKLAAQILDYWMRKRQAEGGPLLPHLWFQQPWKLVAFAGCIDKDDEDFDEHLPFMAVEPRSAHKQRRTVSNRRRISEEDALEALVNLRSELEMLRTLADQVRKREKLKRQLLLLSQQELQMRQQLGVPPAAPVPKTARLHQLARNSTAVGPVAAVPSVVKAESSAAAAARAATSAVGTVRNSKSQAAVGPSAPISLASPRHQPGPDLSKSEAKAADAAAAAASPHEGERSRQTRTSAAAAAAAFELAFAAKRAKAAANVVSAPGILTTGELTASVVTNVAAARQVQEKQQGPVLEPCSKAVCLIGSKRTNGVAVKGAERDRTMKRQQRLAAAAGDAGNKMDEAAHGAAGAYQHTHIASQAAELPRRCRGVQLEVQPRLRAQQQQLSRQRRQHQHKQMREQQQRAAVAAHTAQEQALSSSSSESDDSGDVDYSVSQDVEEVQHWQHYQPPPVKRRRVDTRRRAFIRATGTAGSSSDGAAAAGPYTSDSDDDFQVSSRRIVSNRTTQKQQHLTAVRRRMGVIAAAVQGNVAAAAADTTYHNAAQGQQQDGSSNKHRAHLRASRTAFISQPTAADVAAADSEAANSRQKRDSAAVQYPTKQLRLQRGGRAALHSAAMPSINAARQLLAEAAGCRTMANVDRRVLQLHNQQQGTQTQQNREGKQSVMQQNRIAAAAEFAQYGSVSQPVAATPMPAKRSISHLARPAAGHSRGVSVRRPATAATDRQRPGGLRYAQGSVKAAINRRQLRSVGLQSGIGDLAPPANL